LGPLLSLLHKNELPKEINKTSATIIFVDDTSILFAQSNLIYFYSNIHIVFETLNEWFIVNQLSLNFNNTNCIHFASKRNMSINLKTDLNNNIITNSSYTKFLGLVMDSKLSWNNHIDLFMTKLSMAFYIIRNVKTYVCCSIKNNLSCLFSLGYELWNHILGKLISQFHNFLHAKRQLELWKYVGIEFHVEIYLGN